MKFRLKEIRKAKKFSQEQLSLSSGVSRRIISELESGTRTITRTDTLCRLAKALGVNPTDLIA